MDIADQKTEKSIKDLETFFNILSSHLDNEIRVWAERRGSLLIERIRVSVVSKTAAKTLYPKLPQDLVLEILEYIG